jgi:hypothetical protein
MMTWMKNLRDFILKFKRKELQTLAGLGVKEELLRGIVKRDMIGYSMITFQKLQYTQMSSSVEGIYRMRKHVFLHIVEALG